MKRIAGITLSIILGLGVLAHASEDGNTHLKKHAHERSHKHSAKRGTGKRRAVKHRAHKSSTKSTPHAKNAHKEIKDSF